MVGSVIESDLVVEGNISASGGAISVKGRVKGDIAAQSVEVEDGGNIDGSVSADMVKVFGTQSGSITCKELSLGAASEVKSKVTAQTMASEKGAKLVGEVRITGG